MGAADAMTMVGERDRRERGGWSAMRIGIAGAGIAGLSAALALSRVGHDVRVFEAAGRPAPGDGGAFVNIAPNGMNALGALGVSDAVRAAGFATSGIEFLNHRGRRIGFLDASQQHERLGSQNLMIRRAALHDRLLAAARADGVPVDFGHRIDEVIETAANLRVGFERRSHCELDLLVGADGVRSTVRRHVVPDASVRYLGLVDVAGFAPTAPCAVASGPQRMIFGLDAFFGYYVTPTGETWWFVNRPHEPEPDRETLATMAGPRWRPALLEAHQGAPGVIREILGASDRPVGAWPVTELDPLPRWHTTRVVLIGDAAHATSPSAGQGVSLAAEDAVWLAHHLSDVTRPLPARLRAFERERRPRVERLVGDARRNSSHKTPGVIGRSVRDLALPLLLRLGTRAAERAYDHQLPALVPLGQTTR